MVGSVLGHPAEPVSWTYPRAGGGVSFYTSMGHPLDFKNGEFNSLLGNAIRWSLNRGGNGSGRELAEGTLIPQSRIPQSRIAERGSSRIQTMHLPSGFLRSIAGKSKSCLRPQWSFGGAPKRDRNRLALITSGPTDQPKETAGKAERISLIWYSQAPSAPGPRRT